MLGRAANLIGARGQLTALRIGGPILVPGGKTWTGQPALLKADAA